MNENKLKHLEFIQNVITRLASNSFFVKGWSVTLVSAIFALAAKDADRQFVIVSYVPIIMFWILDGFFISTERRYRKLYAKIAAECKRDTDFSLDATSFTAGSCSWATACFSRTLLVFHGALVAVVLIVMFLIPNVTHP